MSRPRAALAAVVATLALLAAPASARTLRGPAYTVAAPGAWSERPALATLVMLELSGSPALPRGAGVAVLLLEHLVTRGAYAGAVQIDAPAQRGPARPQVLAAAARLRAQLAAVMALTTWTERDDGVILTVRFSGAAMGLPLVGRVLLFVDDGRPAPVLRVFAAACLAPMRTTNCAALVESLTPLVPVAHRRPL